MRYIRFSNAAVAVDHELPATTPASTPREPASPTKTYWALHPLRGRLGTYVALQLRGEQLWVGVRADSRLAWARADQALTMNEAQAWFPRAGFTG